VIAGKVGADLTVEQGYEAARLCGLHPTCRAFTQHPEVDLSPATATAIPPRMSISHQPIGDISVDRVDDVAALT
jgi:hypothetical protein